VPLLLYLPSSLPLSSYIVEGDGGAGGFPDPLAEAVDEKVGREWRAHEYFLFVSQRWLKNKLDASQFVNSLQPTWAAFPKICFSLFASARTLSAAPVLFAAADAAFTARNYADRPKLLRSCAARIRSSG
jgi:hypothetical protein